MPCSVFKFDGLGQIGVVRDVTRGMSKTHTLSTRGMSKTHSMVWVRSDRSTTLRRTRLTTNCKLTRWIKIANTVDPKSLTSCMYGIETKLDSFRENNSYVDAQLQGRNLHSTYCRHLKCLYFVPKRKQLLDRTSTYILPHLSTIHSSQRI